jgi:uncharacterized protein (DUF58 family)
MVLAFLSTMFALDVRRSQLYVAWGALVGLLAASFVASFFYRLRTVRARALVARRVARGAPVKLTVSLENGADVPFVSLRAHGPFLPWDGHWLRRTVGLKRLEARSRAVLELEAAFYRRGEHQLDPVRVQALVPFGLALGPSIVTQSPHFLVVPPIAAISSLTLPRTRRHHPGGIPRAVHTADSRELAGVRPYRAGDAVRDLHVKTWARTGVPHVREYQEEYFAHVAVIVDAAAPPASPERRRRWEDDLPLEAALSLASGIVAKLLRGEALVDVWVLGEERGSSALGRGRGTIEVALDRLAAVARAERLDVARETVRIAAERERLSSVVVVWSAWDEDRRELARALEREGIAITNVVVGPAPPESGAVPRAHFVVAETILSGARVAL